MVVFGCCFFFLIPSKGDISYIAKGSNKRACISTLRVIKHQRSLAESKYHQAVEGRRVARLAKSDSYLQSKTPHRKQGQTTAQAFSTSYPRFVPICEIDKPFKKLIAHLI